MHRTGLKPRQNPDPACAAAGINPLVSNGMSWSSAVIGSGVQWLALVCMWLCPNKCDVAHPWTTQQPCWKSQVSLILIRRDIWATYTQTHRQTEIPCFYREKSCRNNGQTMSATCCRSNVGCWTCAEQRLLNSEHWLKCRTEGFRFNIHETKGLSAVLLFFKSTEA